MILVLKQPRSGLRRKGASDVTSEDETHSSAAEDDKEEEEASDSPLRGEGRKGRPPHIWRPKHPRGGEPPVGVKTSRSRVGGPELCV